MEDDGLWSQYHNLLKAIMPDDPPAPPVQVEPTEANMARVIEIDLDEDDQFDLMALKRYSAEPIGQIRSAHETQLGDLPVDPVPPEIPAQVRVRPVCQIHHHCGNFSVAVAVGDPVVPGSLLVDQNRTPITRVLDLFGPTEEPQMILKGQYEIGMNLFAVDGEGEIPDPDRIQAIYKGCDASNRYDEPEEQPDFSDDEAERTFKANQRTIRKSVESPADVIGYPRT